jgi:uncharacterized glyoxalase superfamily protein PhnB
MDKQTSDGTSNLAPHLVCAGAAEAIDFYKRGFGATERIRMPGPDGKIMHACVAINGAPVMLVDENPKWGALSPKSLGGTPVTIHLNVADVDKVTAQVVAAGAKVIMPVADMFWGDRYGVVEDPFGHRWSIGTQQRKMSEAELKEAAKKAFSAEGACA